jgi:hypothetical protein
MASRTWSWGTTLSRSMGSRIVEKLNASSLRKIMAWERLCGIPSKRCFALGERITDIFFCGGIYSNLVENQAGYVGESQKK